MVNIWKMYWKLTITERLYHFVNISIKKAHIPKRFHEDPCTPRRARSINACTCDEICTHEFTPRTGVWVHESLQNLVW